MKDSTLRNSFAQWAANCLKYDNTKESRTFDLPQLVNIFQAISFEVKHFDVSNDEMVDPHKIRIVITCNRSGQRCILEREVDDNCGCLRHEYDSIPEGYFLEYDSKEKNQLLPPLNDEQSAVIKPTMNYLFGLAKDSAEMNFIKQIGTSNSEEKKPPRDTNHNIKSTEFETFGSSHISIETNGIGNCLHSTRANIQEGGSDSNLTTASNCSECKGILLNPTVTDSPRYRSLDSLTSKNINSIHEIPEPGKLLPKIIVDSVEEKTSLSSISNLSTESGKLYINTKTLNLIKNATAQLTEVLQQMETNKLKVSPGKIGVKLKSASKNLKKFVCTTKVESTSSLKLGSCPNLQPGTSGSKIGTKAAKATKTVNRVYPKTILEEKKTASKLTTPAKFVRSKPETGSRTNLAKPLDYKKSKLPKSTKD